MVSKYGMKEIIKVHNPINPIKIRRGIPVETTSAVIAAFILGYVYNYRYNEIPSNYNAGIVASDLRTEPSVKIETVYIQKVYTEKTLAKEEYKPAFISNERSYGYDIRKQSVNELQKLMLSKGFTDLKGMNLMKLRRLWIAYNYESLLMEVHSITEFPVSMIYAFFIVEATSKGIETDLFRLHGNAGGCKAIKGQKSVTYKTREVIRGRNKYIRAKFFSASSTREGIELWAKVLNSGRYYECKKANWKLPSNKIYLSICKCIYNNGYHTDTDYQFRASLMAEFWKMKRHFPKPS
jgi:hypothetical protein